MSLYLPDWLTLFLSISRVLICFVIVIVIVFTASFDMRERFENAVIWNRFFSSVSIHFGLALDLFVQNRCNIKSQCKVMKKERTRLRDKKLNKLSAHEDTHSRQIEVRISVISNSAWLGKKGGRKKCVSDKISCTWLISRQLKYHTKKNETSQKYKMCTLCVCTKRGSHTSANVRDKRTRDLNVLECVSVIRLVCARERVSGHQQLLSN